VAEAKYTTHTQRENDRPEGRMAMNAAPTLQARRAMTAGKGAITAAGVAETHQMGDTLKSGLGNIEDFSGFSEYRDFCLSL
jgi:hypothetical protein